MNKLKKKENTHAKITINITTKKKRNLMYN